MSNIGSPLNFMYKIEQFATQIYLVQGDGFKGSDTADKLVKASQNEQTHVDLLRTRTQDLKVGLSPWGFYSKPPRLLRGQ